MTTIALQLDLPESAFAELKQKASDAHKPLPEFALEMLLKTLEHEAQLAKGRALLRTLVHETTQETQTLNLPNDLAENHDQYLYQTRL